MARRQLGHGRGGRMKIEKRRRRGHRRRPPRPHARRPDRAPGRQPRLRELGGADEPVAGRGRRCPRCTCRAPATPTSPGVQKFGFTDVRNVLERASARETAARVAGGALAKAFLRALGVEVVSHVTQIGSVQRAASATTSRSRDFAGVDESPVRCLDADADARRWSRRSTCCASATSRSAASSRCARSGSCPGSARTSPGSSGSTGASACALLSIQAVKGVGLGDGFDLAGPARLGGPRRDLLLRGARLLPRDQPLRRARGRHDDRRAAGRARAR